MPDSPQKKMRPTIYKEKNARLLSTKKKNHHSTTGTNIENSNNIEISESYGKKYMDIINQLHEKNRKLGQTIITKYGSQVEITAPLGYVFYKDGTKVRYVKKIQWKIV